MFTITRSKLAALAAVACAAFAVPQALAMPVANGGKTTARVHVTRPASSKAAPTLKFGLNAIYVNGCLSGTIADRTMGGGNNNYDYYGDACT